MSLFTQKAPSVITLLMNDFQLSVEDAGAILGNLGEESGGFELLQEQNPLSGIGGFGWAQWTGPRRTQFFAYCSRNGLDSKSDKANYGFLFVELNSTYARAIVNVRAAIGLTAKVVAFMNSFEMPNAAYAHISVRESYAQEAIAAYGAAQITTPPPVAVPGTGVKSMANNFLDPIRNAVDSIDDKVDAVVKQLDQVKSFPVIGPMVAPYIGIFDELAGFVDDARKALDALDPVATAAVAAAPSAVKVQAEAATAAAKA